MTKFIDLVRGGVGNGVLMAELAGINPGFSLAEDTDDLFGGKTFHHGDVLMWIMKTLLTSALPPQPVTQYLRIAALRMVQ
ncbi:hypothetical protein [Enterobacter kobei]|uniref:hypothetical protein n=1 Tax=Enterobacter kobei TaxID=208224 RepID=UPI0020754496|nr:hypothetical protein [Enterobacter kobei]MCM7506582.1 hypothetical protein [Enterobacter kobei]